MPTALSTDRILGIDPALRATGFGILESDGRSGHRAIAWGVIRNPPGLEISACLLAIRDGLRAAIAEYHPSGAAIESSIFVQNRQSAITLGCARGAAILAVAEAGLSLHEYAPRSVKASTTGRGAASKDQVSFMMRALLGLVETPPSDAADALAVALTHLQRRASPLAAPRKV